MADKEVISYEPVKSRNQASDALLKASVLIIQDDESWYAAREMRRMCKLLDKAAEKHYEQVKKPMNLAIATIRNQENTDREPMEKAIEILDPKILDWEEEQKRLRAALQARLEENARAQAQAARDAEIARFEKAGNQRAADDLRKQPLYIPPVIVPENNAWLDGEGRNEKWQVDEVSIDIVKLAAAVADGRIGPGVFKIHLPSLNDLAEIKQDTGEIPGCKIIRKRGITQR